MISTPPTTVPYAVIDAFVENRPYSGNPAAVCPLNAFLPDEDLQDMAAEHNLSETAFFVTGSGMHRHLRWFTPTVEVNLCGHATLAAAHYLFEQVKIPDNCIDFTTRSGLLSVRREQGLLWMDFPQWPVEPVAIEPAWHTHFGTIRAASRNAANYLILEVDDPNTVMNYQPNAAFLTGIAAFGIVLTAASSLSGTDFVSRFFAPRAGILEDPVTGSAHCSLFPYWSNRLGKTALSARQVSARGGRIEGHIAGGRVILGGRCRTYATGVILAPEEC